MAEPLPGETRDRPAGATRLTVRRDLESLSPGEIDRLRQAVGRLQVTTGPRGYRALADLSLAQAQMGPPSPFSFLPWHRAHLLHFELALQAIDPGVSVPYWDFTFANASAVGLPEAFSLPEVDGAANPLFAGILPDDLVVQGNLPSKRTWRAPGNTFDLPSPATVDEVLAVDDFDDFQSRLDHLHNMVHAWIGGTMNEIPYASYDPLYLPMYAAFDRLFWIWQQQHPAQVVRSRTTPGQLAPFDLTVDDVADVNKLGYTYGEATSGTVPDELAVLAGYRPDSIAGVDCLGVSHEAAGLCCVLIARDIEPPISVGLFGEWGSGKSFFIEQMRSWIREASRRSLAAEAEGQPTLLCSRVKQVTFNAWHYTDANLWASLTVRLFEGLAEADTEELADQEAAEREKQAHNNLLAKLPLYQEQIADARRVQESAAADRRRVEAELANITGQLEAAQGRLRVAATADEVAITAAGDAAVKAGVAALGLALPPGVDASLAALRDRERELSFVGVRLREAMGLAWRQPRRRRILVGCGVVSFLLVGLGVWVLATGKVAGIVALYAAMAPVVLAGFTGVRDALGQIQKWAADTNHLIRTAEQREIDERRRQADELARAQSELQLKVQRLTLQEAAKQAEVDQARAAVVEVQRDIRDMEPGRRLSKFIEQRMVGNDYAKYLGVIALIRRDFEELNRLMRRAREPAEEDDLPRIDRIVLYIDDLDRVPAQRVVEVLQAVHLLLAIPLFVVVVAVDPRWLLKSLQHHYAAMLAGSDDAGGSNESGVWDAHSFNYLEKIFQIPYTLDPMDQVGFKRLIGTLMASAPTTEAPPLAAAGGSAGEAPPSDVVWSTSEARSAVEEARRQLIQFDITPRGLEIDEREIRYMERLAPMIPTPRGAKRLANTYRLIRSSVRGHDLEVFLGSGPTGDYRAVLVLLALLIGYPNQAPTIFEQIRDNEHGTWQQVIDAIPGLVGTTAFDAQHLARQLHTLRDAAGINESLAPFRRWLFPVARYSFQTGRTLLANPSEPVSPEWSTAVPE